MNIELLNSEIQAFIRDNEHSDTADLLLKFNHIHDQPVSAIVDQIIGRRKSKVKIPLYYNTAGILYPPARNVEQSSSQTSAKLKGEIIKQEIADRSKCVDLSGGLGIDALFLSQAFTNLTMVEPNESLLDIARHNHLTLGNTNIEYRQDNAASFLHTSNERYDLIFVDPSRRDHGNNKVYSLKESEPDILSLMDTMFARSTWILIKASPLFDIRQGLQEIPHVVKIFVVAIDNECKELLFLAKQKSDTTAAISAINITEEVGYSLDFSLEEEKLCQATFSSHLKYLYEPNAAILKSGAFKLVSRRFGLHKIHINTHLYTSTEFINEFPGRVFVIVEEVKADRKSVMNAIPGGKTNIMTRNYPLAPAELKKKFKLIDGGSKFLIGFTGLEGKHLVVAERLR